jgi:hypothetical protein
METSFRCRISGWLLVTSQRCDNDGLIWKPPHAPLTYIQYLQQYSANAFFKAPRFYCK